MVHLRRDFQAMIDRGGASAEGVGACKKISNQTYRS
jgi:hypothetical protein